MNVRLVPRDEPGIVFRRSDLPDSPLIPASVASLRPSERRTEIVRGKATVSTVEHLLATCFGHGVTSLHVDVTGPELPIGDGSAQLWSDAFVRAGLRDSEALLDAREVPTLAVERGRSRITVAPCERWSVSFYGEFPDWSSARVCWTAETNFALQLAGARTFCRLSEIASLHRAGLIRGGSPENALVWCDKPIDRDTRAEIARIWPRVPLEFDSRGLLSLQQLRWNDECARHKLVDLLGDLMLLGPTAPSRIEAVNSGHALAHDLVQAIENHR